MHLHPEPLLSFLLLALPLLPLLLPLLPPPLLLSSWCCGDVDALLIVDDARCVMFTRKGNHHMVS
jgi:hypothetical protein